MKSAYKPLIFVAIMAFVGAACGELLEKEPQQKKYMIRVENKESHYAQNFVYDSVFIARNKYVVNTTVFVRKFFKNDYPAGKSEKNDTLISEKGLKEQLTNDENLNETNLVIKGRIVSITPLKGYTVEKKR